MARLWRRIVAVSGWLTAPIRLGGDVEFSWHYLVPWLWKSLWPMVAAVIAGAIAFARDAPFWAIPLLAAGAAMIVAFIAGLAGRAWERLRMPANKAPQTDGISDDRVVISGQDNIVSVGQRGGQTARVIQNVGLQPRTFVSIDLGGTEERLRQYSGTEVLVACLMMDGESRRFADEIAALLARAGWNIKRSNTLIGHGERGVGIRCPDAELPRPLEELARSLKGLGFHTEVAISSDNAGGLEVLVLGN